MKLEFTVPESYHGRRLSDFLHAAGLTTGLIRSIKYQQQGLAVNGLRAKTNQLLCAGQRVTVFFPEEPDTSVQPEEMPLTILYESDFSMVFNKPAGQLVHPSVAQAQGTLAGGWCWLMEQRGTPAPMRPITRIDKNTSGLVLCAKNRFAAPLLGKNLHKVYYAVAEGEMPLGKGVIDAPIALAEGSGISRCVAPGGKPSVTDYTVLCAQNGHSLVRVEPRTGRTHQIRVHFAFLGHPLAGDDMYGGSRKLISRHALHAAELRFWEPLADAPRTLAAPLPQDLQELCENLGFLARILHDL